MNNLKLFLKLYFSPASAMSDIMDKGNWLLAAGMVLTVALLFFATINARLEATYRIPNFNEFYQPDPDEEIKDSTEAKAAFDQAVSAYGSENASRQRVPVVGDRFFSFFSFEPGEFYRPLLLLSIFYVPTIILLMSLFGGVGNFGIVLRRDYGTLAVCTLMAWAAAHLPFALAGILLYPQNISTQVYLAMWTASGLLFGVLMVFAVRTVFGANYGTAIMVVGFAWLSMSLGMYVFRFVSPWLFSPFLIFFAVIYLGGFLGGEVRGFGNAFRRKQDFKRFLHTATVNPKDADAHVQLGLIYLQRRQESKALEHLNKAIEIDETEIDANYELGKIARAKGDLPGAISHFSVVVEQSDKYSLSEIWREIGATYLEANMLDEASDALDKFVERRSVDPEGLYYFGKVLKAQGKTEKARDMFEQAVESANTSPDYHRRRTRHWSKLAQKEI